MGQKTYKRKKKEERPVIAICYDFDKTLSPDDMQAQGYIQSAGYDIDEFWRESNERAERNDMDQNLAYMYKMVEAARGKILLTKETLNAYGGKVKLFPGVEEWFERIREYGEAHGVIIEHYIISSGLKEMIEGTEMAKKGAFEKIYASAFYFNEYGEAVWPAQAINYTNKTQFLFRISKGVLDINDQSVNDYFSEDEIRIPFRDIVYIGDSDTDIPCMKLVNSYGGYSIGVYNPDTKDKKKVYKMMNDNRISLYAAADYNPGSELDDLVKKIICKTAENEKIIQILERYRKEARQSQQKNSNDNEEKKETLIMKLVDSKSFVNTHATIKELSAYKIWSDNEKEEVFQAAMNNQQIKLILKDKDITKFYKFLLEQTTNKSELAKEVERELR